MVTFGQLNHTDVHEGIAETELCVGELKSHMSLNCGAVLRLLKRTRNKQFEEESKKVGLSRVDPLCGL